MFSFLATGIKKYYDIGDTLGKGSFAVVKRGTPKVELAGWPPSLLSTQPRPFVRPGALPALSLPFAHPLPPSSPSVSSMSVPPSFFPSPPPPAPCRLRRACMLSAHGVHVCCLSAHGASGVGRHWLMPFSCPPPSIARSLSHKR